MVVYRRPMKAVIMINFIEPNNFPSLPKGIRIVVRKAIVTADLDLTVISFLDFSKELFSLLEEVILVVN